jgi:malonate-semialdehyde dehydrogenase (acetylating)/methylmalonate-semialdehyde dehydrogenase
VLSIDLDTVEPCVSLHIALLGLDAVRMARELSRAQNGAMTTTSTIGHWLGGKPWEGSGGRLGDVTEPASGALSAQVRFASAADVDEVVAAAKGAFESWRRTSLARRSEILFAFRELVSRHREDLASTITREHGKVASDALGEVQRGLEVVDFACGLGHLLKGGASWNVSRDVDSDNLRQPLGVAVGITPFNFPVMVPMWMHPVAIACGNTFVLKPSEKDPSASLLSAELWAQAGLPEGVFNVVQGDRECVDRLLGHPDVAAVSFVGSTPVARHVYATAAAAGKRVQALGGAKNHMVVLPDADLDVAADAAVGAAYGSAGERCMAISVVVAVGPDADDLVERIHRRAAALQVGPGEEPGSEMGPLVTAEHRDRVAGYVDAGLAEGATLVLDGRGTAVDGHEDGFWLGPCLFDHVTPGMRVYREEIFGPVLCVVRAEDHDEALRLVNENPYGNGVAVFTRSGSAARWFSSEVTAGMVGVNVPIPVPMAYYSFGGWKDSFFGSHHVHGMEGVAFYTQNKTITTRWPDSQESSVELGFPQNR